MIRYRIAMPQATRNLFRHLPPELKGKVKAALRAIADNPYRAKELREDLTALRSYPIAKARLIYRIAGATVEIVAFGPRADIYERAATELSKSLRKNRSD